jgi:Transposase IS200 like
MQHYLTSAHTRLDINYHVVWTTKYRKRVLRGPMGLRVWELNREVCRSREVEILHGHVAADHVHLLGFAITGVLGKFAHGIMPPPRISFLNSPADFVVMDSAGTAGQPLPIGIEAVI